MKRAAVVGLGLMGGSLGMALRRQGWRVTGVGRDGKSLEKARAAGAADEATTRLSAGVQGADVVFLAVPVKDIVPLAEKARPGLKPGALVMDVGSVKGPIVRSLARWPSEDGPVFLGAHPMCGSEKSGVENARADLFEGATCVLTPTGETPPDALKTARKIWAGLGARVLLLTPEEHDLRVALVSHLPHLIAQALVSTAFGGGRRAGERARSLAAGSFRDATRVAAADPALWAQIFSMNRPALARAVDAFQRNLRALAKAPTAARLSRIRQQHRTLSGASL